MDCHLRRLHLVTFCGAVGLLAGCGSSNRDGRPPAPRPASKDPSAAPTATAGDTAAPAAAKAADAPPIHRDLTVEAGRAELRAGGTWIDFGTLDAHKYHRGGWLTGWGRNALDGEVTLTPMADRSAWVDVVTDAPVSEIAVRARASSSDRLDVRVDGKRVGRAAATDAWTVARVVLDEPVPPGRHRIELSSRHKRGGTALDWMWLSETAGATPPDAAARVAAASFGGVERTALMAPSPRTYSFYVDVPAGAVLDVAPGADGAAYFTVTATADGAEPVALGTAKLDAPGWRPQSLSLSLAPVEGKTVRLDLTTAGDASAAWGRPVIRAPRAKVPSLPGDAKAPRNVIVLLIDTVRADVFSPFATDGGIGAESFEGLVPQSTLFRWAYNNENWTKPSIASTKSGVYPGSHGARWRVDKVPEDLVFLSEHLQAQGFATASLVSNKSAGPKFGFDQGWDHWEKTDDAKHIFERALAWLDAKPEGRFYLFVQSIDPHTPYIVPREFSKPFYKGKYRGKIGGGFDVREEENINRGKLRVSEDDIAWVRAIYNGEVMYHDKYMAEFLADLDERGVLDDTLFVILNDHGEDLGEHGRFGHGWTMWEPQYRSPLLFRFPGTFPPGQIVEEVVEHVDVAPTIAEALGVPPMTRAEGRSLMDLARGEPTWPRPYYALLFAKPDRRGVRVGRWKLVVRRDEPSLYDVVADPGETEDRWAEQPIAARMCEVHLGEALANPDKAHRLDDRFDYQPYTPGKIRE